MKETQYIVEDTKYNALLLTISSIGVPNAISKLVSEKVAVRR